MSLVAHRRIALLPFILEQNCVPFYAMGIILPGGKKLQRQKFEQSALFLVFCPEWNGNNFRKHYCSENVCFHQIDIKEQSEGQIHNYFQVFEKG